MKILSMTVWWRLASKDIVAFQVISVLSRDHEINFDPRDINVSSADKNMQYIEFRTVGTDPKVENVLAIIDKLVGETAVEIKTDTAGSFRDPAQFALKLYAENVALQEKYRLLERVQEEAAKVANTVRELVADDRFAPVRKVAEDALSRLGTAVNALKGKVKQ